MEKSILVFLLMCSMLITVAVPAFAADTVTARPTTSTIIVNGEDVSFDAYNIEGNNYFKLRGLAAALSGTERQFEVKWDGDNNAINLTSGEPYTVIGGEMTSKGEGDRRAIPTNSRIYLDGIEVQFTAYNIGDNNYFKLRDIGTVFDFSVDWVGASNTVIVDTSRGYTNPTLQDQLIHYLSDLFTVAYDMYYDGLHFRMSQYDETIVEDSYTSTFFWTMYYLDNGLDIPSDFGKEQEANWFLQVTAKTSGDRLDTTTIVTLADTSVTGTPAFQIPIDEYFPSVEKGAIPKKHSIDYRDYGIDYNVTEMNFDQFPINKLVAYYLGADAAYAEGSNEVLYQRFLENPRTVLIYIALVGDNLTRGDVPAKNALCIALASADVFWHDISDSFSEILEQFSEVNQSGGIADVLALLKTEREAAIIRYNNH